MTTDEKPRTRTNSGVLTPTTRRIINASADIDAGRSVAETPFPSLNAKAVTLMQSIVDRTTTLEKQGAA